MNDTTTTQAAEGAVETQGQDVFDQQTAEQIASGEPSPSNDIVYAGKFKSAEALETSYLHLQKKLGEMSSRLPKAPEEYTFDFSESEDFKATGINLEEDPIYAAMVPVFKETNLTQDQANLLMNTYFKGQAEFVKNNQRVVEAEKAKLEDYDGKNSYIISKLNELLSEDQASAIAAGESYKAAYVEGMNNLLRHMTKADVKEDIPESSMATVSKETSAELKKQARQIKEDNPNWKRDLKLREKYTELTRKAAAIDLKLEQDAQRQTYI